MEEPSVGFPAKKTNISSGKWTMEAKQQSAWLVIQGSGKVEDTNQGVGEGLKGFGQVEAKLC